MADFMCHVEEHDAPVTVDIGKKKQAITIFMKKRRENILGSSKTFGHFSLIAPGTAMLTGWLVCRIITLLHTAMKLKYYGTQSTFLMIIQSFH